LAHLFTQPSNLLVLDEPTNDLDVETLEVLEDRLLDYSGTLIAVSHDREFLDNVVTSIVVFEQDGRVREYIGGYRDWLRHGRSLAAVDGQGVKLNEPSVTVSGAGRQAAKPRLTYKLQRELDKLPGTISRLEGEVEVLRKEVAAPGFYDHPYDMTRPVLDRLQVTEAELEAVVERWAELEESGKAIKDAR
jgi:ATP-binding cassette subfamily F protein uup